MHIDIWFTIAGTIGAEICHRNERETEPDYLMIAARFRGFADKARATMDLAVAKLWEDGAELARRGGR